MTGVEQIVKDTTLTFEQKVVALARYVMRELFVIYLREMFHIVHAIFFLTMRNS